MAALKNQPGKDAPRWLETEAKVTACRYRFSGSNLLLLGVATDSNHYLISFSYYAHAKTYNDQFTSPVAIGQGETIIVRYNPLNPRENDKSAQSSTARSPLFAIGIAGSVILSLLYLALVRSCN